MAEQHQHRQHLPDETEPEREHRATQLAREAVSRWLGNGRHFQVKNTHVEGEVRNWSGIYVAVKFEGYLEGPFRSHQTDRGEAELAVIMNTNWVGVNVILDPIPTAPSRGGNGGSEVVEVAEAEDRCGISLRDLEQPAEGGGCCC